MVPISFVLICNLECFIYIRIFLAYMNVRLSEISNYLKCPRMLYFMQNNSVFEPSEGYFTHILLKELAMVIPSALESGDVYSYLENEFERIVDELPLIYKAEIAGHDALYYSAVASVHDEVHSLSQSLIDNVDVKIFQGAIQNDGEVTLYLSLIHISEPTR